MRRLFSLYALLFLLTLSACGGKEKPAVSEMESGERIENAETNPSVMESGELISKEAFTVVTDLPLGTRNYMDGDMKGDILSLLSIRYEGDDTILYRLTLYDLEKKCLLLDHEIDPDSEGIEKMPEYISFIYLLDGEDGDVVCIGGPNEEKALFYDLSGNYLKTDICPAYEKHEKDQKLLEENAGNFFYYRDYALRYSEADPDKGAILCASDPDTFYLGDISIINSCFDSEDGLFIGSIQEEGEIPNLFAFDLKKRMIIGRKVLSEFKDKYTGFMAICEDKAIVCVDDWAENGDSLQSICIWDYKQDAVEESVELTSCLGKELEAMAEEKLLSMNESFPMRFHMDEQPYEDAFGFIKPATLGISSYGRLNLLSVIEEELLKFPEGLLSEIPCDQFSGIDVFLVKRIEDSSVGAYADNVNGMLYVVFAEDTFNRGDVSHEFMHLMEWRLLYHYKDQADDIDAIWNKLNPNGFEYMWDDWVSADVDEERDAYFYSAYGMKSEWEDKATIFAAMFEDNSWPFETYAPLRKKAEKLCALIRECYPSCEDRDDLCWEMWMQEESS